MYVSTTDPLPVTSVVPAVVSKPASIPKPFRHTMMTKRDEVMLRGALSLVRSNGWHIDVVAVPGMIGTHFTIRGDPAALEWLETWLSDYDGVDVDDERFQSVY